MNEKKELNKVEAAAYIAALTVDQKVLLNELLKVLERKSQPSATPLA